MTSTMDLADAYGNQRMTDGHHDVTEDHPHTLKARAALEQRIKELEANDRRYKWLRENCDWTNGGLVVTDINNVRLGSMCPSFSMLDETLDRAMSEAALTKAVEISQEYKLP